MRRTFQWFVDVIAKQPQNSVEMTPRMRLVRVDCDHFSRSRYLPLPTRNSHVCSILAASFIRILFEAPENTKGPNHHAQKLRKNGTRPKYLEVEPHDVSTLCAAVNRLDISTLTPGRLRVKDPKRSVAFYKHLGLSLIRKLEFPEAKFDLYFLGSLVLRQSGVDVDG